MSSPHPSPRAQEFWACLALRHTDRLGTKTCKKLIQEYGSAHAAIVNAGRWTRDHLVRPSVADIFSQEKWSKPARAEWEDVRRRQYQVLLYTDPDYPVILRQIPDPPLYMYLAGDRSLLRSPCVAMVGSRKCTSYGQSMAKTIAAGLSQAGISVVSGFALGIDRLAHLGGLRHQGRTIAVLGTGLDVIYPPQNKDLWSQMTEQGLILTEFAPGNEPDAHHFPRRNRIISGLCIGVVVVEAAQKSGSLITARLALEYNREVFAVPGQANMPSFAGCLDLLKQGAVLTCSAQDVLEELAFQLQSSQENETSNKPRNSQPKKHPVLDDLASEEQALARLLSQETQMHIDALTHQLGWESNKVSQILLMLELKGVIRQQNGMYYALA
jgi:DNA processing protein